MMVDGGLGKEAMRLSVVESICKEYDIILASSSPRRYEIVHDIMGFAPLKVMKPSFAEDLDKTLYRDNPVGYVRDTSRRKAESVLKQLVEEEARIKSSRPKLAICADTVIIDNDKIIYEKPSSKAAQLATLTKFCYDKPHFVSVVTAVTLVLLPPAASDTPPRVTETFYEETRVVFDPRTPQQILEDYVASGDGLQVAGGFKIQSCGGVLISRIEGDYFNVVGLPLSKTFNAIIAQTRKKK